MEISLLDVLSVLPLPSSGILYSNIRRQLTIPFLPGWLLCWLNARFGDIGKGIKTKYWLTLGKQMQIPTLEFFCEGREQKTSPPLCLYRVHVTLCIWNVQRADVVFADKKTFLRFQISSLEIFPSCFFHHNSVFYIRGKKDKIRIVIFIYLF